MSSLRAFVAACVVLGLTLAPRVAGAERVALDRAVVRFSAPETGGARSPRFIFERTLAFEARIEALADPDRATTRDVRPYRERHVRAALERHVAETLLSSLRIDPEPSEQDLSRQTESARRMLYERAGGPIASTKLSAGSLPMPSTCCTILPRRKTSARSTSGSCAATTCAASIVATIAIAHRFMITFLPVPNPFRNHSLFGGCRKSSNDRRLAS